MVRNGLIGLGALVDVLLFGLGVQILHDPAHFSALLSATYGVALSLVLAGISLGEIFWYNQAVPYLTSVRIYGGLEWGKRLAVTLAIAYAVVALAVWVSSGWWQVLLTVLPVGLTNVFVTLLAKNFQYRVFRTV